MKELFKDNCIESNGTAKISCSIKNFWSGNKLYYPASTGTGGNSTDYQPKNFMGK